jgi:hypothetical protein
MEQGGYATLGADKNSGGGVWGNRGMNGASFWLWGGWGRLRGKPRTNRMLLFKRRLLEGKRLIYRGASESFEGCHVRMPDPRQESLHLF